jgi:copper chaperone NosL
MRKLFFTVIAAMLIWIGCETTPETLETGKSTCSHCGKAITDMRLAAQLIRTDKTHVHFDTIECMILYTRGDGVSRTDIASYWVTAFNDPNLWLRAENIFFLQSDQLTGDNQPHIAAFDNTQTVNSAYKTFGGLVMKWNDVKRIVAVQSRGKRFIREK